MFVDNIKLVNFRSFSDLTLKETNSPLCILAGKNGAGKTTILEAMYLLSTGIGIHTRKNQDFVKFGTPGFRVQASVLPGEPDTKTTVNYSNTTLAMKYKTEEKRQLSLDEHPAAGMSEFIGKIRVSLMQPDDISLIEGGPANRRKFLNILLSQSKPKYFNSLKRYRRALKQKMKVAYFGERKMSRSFGIEMLTEMPTLFSERSVCVKKLEAEIVEISELMKFDGKISLDYRPAVPKGALAENESNWEKVAEKCIKEGDKLEEMGSHSQFGPSRDEIVIRLDDINVRKYGSQGQKRIISLLLRLAEASLLKHENNAPLVLIDDVFGELDNERRKAFMDLVKASKYQTWIATTSPEIYLESWSKWVKFDINRGILKEVERS
ncbi:MAG: DNA replication and repair protein RecF [Candidatus Lindowbacteria bacterium]|nr:DNA replication and repair protein RecF [Candidatus Lindowbacteria bacterium]